MTARGSAKALKERVPAIEGWFTIDSSAPVLLGSRCRRCGNVSFPKEAAWCRNPSCDGTEFDEAVLSRTGKIWSYTDARYQPPAPYVAPDPYEPFCIVAVELAAEKMVVMGQLVEGVAVDQLRVGQEVELVISTLYEDDDHEYLVWKWRPLQSGAK